MAGWQLEIRSRSRAAAVLRNREIVAGLLFATGILTAETTGARDLEYPEFAQPNLAAGREVWIANCLTCHGYGIAGAPNPTEPGAWDERLEKGRETLYHHALNGFFGPGDTMMPARGGNPVLTDEQVKFAVDYMVALARLVTERTE